MRFTRVIIQVLLAWIPVYGFAQSTAIHYLSGTDKDHTVDWDFYCTTGRKSGQWQKIPVPSNWEMQGFGTFNYFKDSENPEEEGRYKHKFKAPKQWSGKKIFIVFEGVMTDAEVKINGKSAGPMHQGGFYQFRYEIGSLLQYDAENTLEVTVRKHSSNESINRAEREADFWLFGGIFRPVYLEIAPPVFIERVALNAKANGEFSVQVFTNATQANQTLEARVEELNGKMVETPFLSKAGNGTTLSRKFAAIQTWNPERPYLYHLVVTLKENGKIIHTKKERFGFRTAELRPRDGFYVNGVKVIFKGVNRHSQWPESGRTLSRDIHLMDIRLMKEMNMNAVRMSHYPPDQEFLDLCDSLGLFVLDELTGWQKSYDTTIARKLVKELVLRDVNHPAVVLWCNGNEGGWNRGVDKDYALYDPQQRHVIHPWEKFNGTDTKHYPDFNFVTNASLYGEDVFFPTEFMHGLFDGGHGASLEDFWSEMMKHPHAAGGFLWSLHDEGVVRSDRGNTIDVAKNQAPDGIVGPHREKEGSFYTIKEIWSPVVIDLKELPLSFKGVIPVENRFLYTNLRQCRFEWKLMQLPTNARSGNAGTKIAGGGAVVPALQPGEKGMLRLPAGINFTAGNVLYLTAYGPDKKEIYTWSWWLHSTKEMTAEKKTAVQEEITLNEDAETLSVVCDKITYTFSKQTGYLKKVQNGAKPVSFSNGPSLAGSKQSMELFIYYRENNSVVIAPKYTGDASFSVKWIFRPGNLPALQYNYRMRNEFDYAGIVFEYPEENITGMRWMGQGPYHVWKNRLKGTQWGVWQKAYNNTITGESWNYPEFKGWHANVRWVTIQNKESDFSIYSAEGPAFLQMLQPAKPVGATNENTSPKFPGNTIGFFHGISSIGTKFQDARFMGPQAQKNVVLNSGVSGVLLFDFK